MESVERELGEVAVTFWRYVLLNGIRLNWCCRLSVIISLPDFAMFSIAKVISNA